MNQESFLYKPETQPQMRRMLFLVYGDIDEVASRLAREGVEITDIFFEIGVIRGVVEASREESCGVVDGVVAIKDESGIVALSDQLRESS